MKLEKQKARQIRGTAIEKELAELSVEESDAMYMQIGPPQVLYPNLVRLTQIIPPKFQNCNVSDAL